MKTRIIKLDQSPYENGKKTGLLFQKEINEVMDKYLRLSHESDILEKCSMSLKKLKQDYPVYYDEVKGRADGAGTDLDAFWVMMCPEIVDKADHCTTITTRKKNGSFILSHNEDDNYTEGNCFLSKIYTYDGWFATLDIFNMPFGNAFSWNSHGIVKTINYCYEPDVQIGNISRYFGQRHISEATSLDDLIKRCNDIDTASGFHVNAVDRNTNTAVSIEVYPQGSNVIYISDNYFHTNHYIHEKYKYDPQTDEDSNSIFRLEKAKELFSELQTVDLNNIKNILRYRDDTDDFYNSIFQTEKDPYLTGMNFSFDMDEKDTVYIDTFVANESLTLDYELI